MYYIEYSTEVGGNNNNVVVIPEFTTVFGVVVMILMGDINWPLR